jgi:molecular chaperone HtpG
MNEKGNISINTENILPIIKKWLYSDKDIFLREVVSNAVDAITKHKKVAAIGEDEAAPKYRVDVKVNKKENIITVSDNGIGMTFDDVKQYINQIAFSGAIDFFEKYKDKTDAKDQIIGHFGLGFYSVFMVSENVEIETKSYIKTEGAVHWQSDGVSGFEMTEGKRDSHGTDIILHINSDKENKELMNVWKLREILEKYCKFLPYEIYLSEEGAKKDGDDKPINNISPLWLKDAKDCTDEEYKKFYTDVFHDYREPLFWIHLKMDYPINLHGILYFPKLTNDYNTMEGKIQLYCNQVYVADNIKEVIPEYLLLLKGVIDCPDLPLNVSRSFLQNDGYSTKISGHISKKVSDKLKQLYKSDAQQYYKYWDDINLFVKYGCLKEDKFYDKVKECIVYKDLYGKHYTFDEYRKLAEDKDKRFKDKIFYVSDQKTQAQYMNMFKEHELNAVILDNVLDPHFISFIESKNSGVTFESIDSAIKDVLGTDEKVEGFDGVKKYFEDLLKDNKVTVELKAMKATDVSGVITANEYENRMKGMQSIYGSMDLPMSNTLVLNTENPSVKKLAAMEDGDKKKDIAMYIYQLAMLTAGKLEKDGMSDFIKRINEMLNRI